MVTLYIAGPITGVVDYKDCFLRAEEKLLKVGYGAVNPCKLPHKDVEDWRGCMRVDIAAMMEHADGVAALSGWFESEGAYLEVTLARGLGIPVQMVESWCASACVRGREI